MFLGVVISIIFSMTGMYLSYFYNLPSGLAIVLVTSGLFAIAFLFSLSQGILTNPHTTSSTPALWKKLKSVVK